jgi:tRNA G18 (ribose-2'-O)-methylase SpoU
LSYIFLQCTNDHCRFRFPASAAEAEALVCPRCLGLVALAAAALQAKPASLELSATGPILVGLLDNIRSIHNVGSIFRTADGAGVAGLYLGGITATPEHPKLAKAALGANETIPWSYYPNSLDAASALRAVGFQLWALERLSPPATFSPDIIDIPPKLALVVGNERAGIDPGLLALCDVVVSLPMAGHKSSLNAAVAFGIAIYGLRYGKMLSLMANPESGGRHDDDGQARQHAGGHDLGRHD